MYVHDSLFMLLLATYIHAWPTSFSMFVRPWSALTTSTSVNLYVKTKSTYMYVKPGQHICMLSAFIGEHTYTPIDPKLNMHTHWSYLCQSRSTYMYVVSLHRRTYIHSNQPRPQHTELPNTVNRQPHFWSTPQSTVLFNLERQIWFASGGPF